MPFSAKWMDLEIIILLKPNRYKYYILLMCGFKKKCTNELISKRERTHYMAQELYSLVFYNL